MLLCTKGGLQINIAIVDDQTSECEILTALLQVYEAEQGQPLKVQEFHNCIDLLGDYQQGKFDVIFMDIFLDEESGMDCAMKIRQLDETVNIIFLTTSSEFGVKSYDVRAVDYIVKPATLAKLTRALNYCKTSVEQNPTLITVCIRNQPLEIALDRILYADFINRSTSIHLKDRIVSVSGTFTELANQLTAYPRFTSCFKGIVVNLQEVQEIGEDYLVLKNGARLPISRRLQRHVQLQLLSLSAGSLRSDWV